MIGAISDCLHLLRTIPARFRIRRDCPDFDLPLSRERRAPRTRKLFPVCFYTALCRDESVHPLADVLSVIVSGGQNGDLRIFYLLAMRQGHIAIVRDQEPALTIAESDNSRVFNALLYALPRV